MIKTYLKNSIELHQKLLSDENFIKKLQNIIDIISLCYKRGNKLLIAGNGGSAADSQHFAAEIIVRYQKARKAYPAIALNADSSVLTACGNDYDFSQIFARQIEAIGSKGDIFFAISTSGNSKNIIEALKTSKDIGIASISLLGNDGGEAQQYSDYSIIIPSDKTALIQEAHIMIIHIICEHLDLLFTKQDAES